MTTGTVAPRSPERPSRYRPGWGDVLGVLALFSIIGPVGLWLMNHGLPVPLGMKSTVGMLGLLFSLIATQLMLLLIVLMARIPLVERAWGHDLLARRHRWVGFASFWFMLGHIVAQSVERMDRDWSVAWGRLWELLVVEPWMLWATVGTIMIIGVMVTSMRWARGSSCGASTSSRWRPSWYSASGCPSTGPCTTGCASTRWRPRRPAW